MIKIKSFKLKINFVHIINQCSILLSFLKSIIYFSFNWASHANRILFIPLNVNRLNPNSSNKPLLLGDVIAAETSLQIW